jgi:hypothetical protein
MACSDDFHDRVRPTHLNHQAGAPAEPSQGEEILVNCDIHGERHLRDRHIIDLMRIIITN